MIYSARWLALLLGSVLMTPWAAHAQEKPRRYVELEFDGNLEQTLRRQLMEARRDEVLKRLLEEIKKNPEFKKLPKLDPDDPKLKELQDKVQDWVEKHPNDLKPNPELIQDIKKTFIDSPMKTKSSPPGNPKGPGSTDNQPKPPGNPGPKAPEKDSPPPQQLLQKVMKEIEGSKFGQQLKGSAAWREGRINLQRFKVDEKGASLFDVEGIQKMGERLRELGDKSLTLPGGVRPKLPDWKPPNFPRPNLNGGGLPPIAGPDFDLRMPSSLAWSQGAEVLLVIVVVALTAYLLWSLVKLGGFKRGKKSDSTFDLGPWPVDPQRIRTPAELVRAFDYLALLLLGLTARTWHHRAIAVELGGTAEEKQTAAYSLACVYEQARYAPEAGKLPAQDLETARRALCFLAGVTKA